MRILIIIDGLPGGGAEKVVLTLAQHFANLGDQVTLFSLRDVCHYPLPDNIHYRLIADHSHAPWRKLTELRRRARAVDQAIHQAEQQGRFELVLSNLHKTDRIVAHSRLLAERNVWHCLHGIFSRSYLRDKTGFRRWLKQQKIRRIYQQRNLVCVSRAVADDIQQHFAITPARLQIFYNPFDLPAIRQLAQQPCDMAGKDYLIHVGRFHVSKRHDRLLEAYAQSGLQAPLVLLGDDSGERRQQILQQAQRLGISERVLCKGFIDNPMPWIRHARLLVLSSDSEGFGNVLVEALAVNTPVVSTRCGGAEEILTGELACGLCPRNSLDLARTLQHIYHNPPSINPDTLTRFDSQQIVASYRALGKKDSSTTRGKSEV